MSGGYGLRDSGESGRDPRKRPAFRGIYLFIGASLAVAATGTLIVTDNPRLLKTAVIVAVWACVFALLAGSRPRRDGELSSSREEELRRTYELEIDREVAARREYELRLEVAMRRELENHLKQDLGELRNELGTLRKEMAERWNGELRLERFALRAESTRLTGADRQMLEQQADRLGLDKGSRTEISYDIEQGTSTLRTGPRPAATPPLPNGRSIEPAAGGRSHDEPANGWPAANRRQRDEPVVRPVTELPVPKPTPPEPARPDPLFGPLPAGLPEPEWPPANGGYGRYSGEEPQVTLSARRHRRRAEETGNVPIVPSEPVTPPTPFPETPFRPRMADAGRHGRDETPEPPRRRRRYRDDDDENDVLARMRQQR